MTEQSDTPKRDLLDESRAYPGLTLNPPVKSSKSAAEVVGGVAIAALVCALIAFIVYAFAIA